MAHDDDSDTARAALLAAYRRRAEPPHGAAERGWAGLQRRIARGEQDPLADADPAPTAPSRRPWLLAVAAAAAVLLAVGLSYGTARHGGLAAAFEAVFGPPAPPPARELVPAPPPAPAPSDMSPAPGPEGQADSGLARELALVRAADAAVRAGDGAAALARADGYLAAHPRGTFAPEARLHRAAALCLLGRGDEARRAAAEFARDYPTSPLRARVAAVCAEASPATKIP